MPKTKSISFPAFPETFRQLAYLVQEAQKAKPGTKTNRSDVIRDLVADRYMRVHAASMLATATSRKGRHWQSAILTRNDATFSEASPHEDIDHPDHRRLNANERNR